MNIDDRTYTYVYIFKILSIEFANKLGGEYPHTVIL